MEKKETYQLMYDIKSAYKNNKSEEEIIAMYTAIEDKEAVNANDANTTYLHLAAEFADAKAIEYLLEQGLRANVKNRYGQTLLHALAIGTNEIKRDAERIKETAGVLLKARVSALMRDEDAGDLCYHAALKKENLAFVYAMIDNKVKLDMVDKEGQALLHILVNYPARYAQESLKYKKDEEEIAEIKDKLEKCFELAKALIEYGLDPDAKDRREKSPADYAVEYDLGKITLLLKGEYDESDNSMMDKIASKGKSLHQAAENDFEALEALIRLGTDVNEVCTEGRDYKNMTPLGVACKILNINAINALLAAGADPNMHDGENENSAMYFLIEYSTGGKNDTERHDMGRKVLKALLDAGLDINGFVDNK